VRPDLKSVTVKIELPAELKAQAVQATYFQGAVTGALGASVLLILLYLWSKRA
jgi:hypothetical protein